MRITSGEYKGRVIKMPGRIRPTQEKVRKALFDILGDIKGASFLELFAGSGAIGFEAASRGVKELSLVEDNPSCILTMKKNIESLALKNCTLYAREAQGAIRALHRSRKEFDIIFLDPPYYKDLFPRFRSGSKATVSESLSKKTLQTLSAYDILAPSGFIITQHFHKENLPDKLGDLSLFRDYRYGDTVLSFYKRS